MKDLIKKESVFSGVFISVSNLHLNKNKRVYSDALLDKAIFESSTKLVEGVIIENVDE